MTRSLVLSSSVAISLAQAAAAHPGAHVHPHNGAAWLAVISALAALVVGWRVAVRVRSNTK